MYPNPALVERLAKDHVAEAERWARNEKLMADGLPPARRYARVGHWFMAILIILVILSGGFIW